MRSLAARAGGVGEKGASQFHRIEKRVLGKLAAVEDQFEQPAGQALLARLHIDGAAGIEQVAARLTDVRARKVEIGGGQLQRARMFRFADRHHVETVAAPAHMYQVSGKQYARASAG